MIFLDLLIKIFPLYLIILLGFLVGKYLKAQSETLASILIYTITPVIIFHGIVTTEINIGMLILPVIYFSIASVMCIIFYKFTKNIIKDNTRNILAFAAGTGNTGYFGLPLAISIFGERAFSIVSLMIVGGIIYEATIGFFITARGRHTIEESIKKLLKLPLIYAFILGLFINLLQIKLPQIYFDTIMLYRGAYTVLGMMIVGLGLSEIEKFNLDYQFLSLIFLAKFFLWPIMMFLVILLDINLFNFFNSEIHNIMFLISLTPIAANTVSFASLLKVQPQKAAIAVLLSTLFALFYIPLIVSLFLN